MKSLSFGKLFKFFWQHPLTLGVDVNSQDRLFAHQKLIKAKPILKAHLSRWYQEFIPTVNELKPIQGKMIELGSGAGFIEEFFPDVIKTDMIKTPFVHEIQDACSLTYPDQSLKAIFMVGVFHHLFKPREFLKEAQRTLVPGGRIVLVEPNNTFPQKILCKVLDHYEYFDPHVKKWENESSQLMTKANLALPWIVFFRDRKIFEEEFPEFKIINIRYHSLFLCLLSGGMTYRSFVPSLFLPVVQLIEFLLSPFMKYVGTSMTIEIEKQKK